MNLKSIPATVSLMVCTLMASSQVTTPSSIFTNKGNDQDSVEIVTVGSIMPYNISPFNWGSLKEIMNPSIFKWWLNGNANGYDLLKSDGITPLTPLPPPNNVYYPDSSISIHWLKTGKYRIKVNEKSEPKTKIKLCDNSSDIQTLSVLVLDRPTASWDSAISKSGCNFINTTQYAPVTVKSSGKTIITYTLVYTPQSGAVTTQTGLTQTFNSLGNDTLNSVSIPINITGYGTYEIAITGITDKIATKCGIVSQPADVPSDKYTITVLSDLETSPIQFVRELK